MTDVKNLNGKLVCRIDEVAGIVEIVLKNCKTLIYISPAGKIEIANIKEN